MFLSNKGVNMRVLTVITKLTAWASMHSLTKYIWLTLVLFAFVAYPNPTLAADVSSTQSKPVGGKETISGAFGIKFGEDIKPYLEGHYSDYEYDMQGYTLRYMLLKPPINVKEMLSDARSVEPSGISDDNNHVIGLRLGVYTETSECGRSSSVKAMMEFLRGKYKITKPQKYSQIDEEYGDGEGNKIRMSCSGNYFSVTYISHLQADYIARLNAEQKKKQDQFKESLKKVM
jgi:hypothetical protein